VDSIAWSSNEWDLACTTGLQSQKAGFLVRLERDHLRLVSFEELPRPFCQAAYSERYSADSVVVLNRKTLDSYSCGGGWNWSVEAPGNLDMAVNSERREIGLTDGSIRRASDGKAVGGISPLKGCSGIAVRPGGGYVGVSEAGVIRVWNERI